MLKVHYAADENGGLNLSELNAIERDLGDIPSTIVE